MSLLKTTTLAAALASLAPEVTAQKRKLAHAKGELTKAKRKQDSAALSTLAPTPVLDQRRHAAQIEAGLRDRRARARAAVKQIDSEIGDTEAQLTALASVATFKVGKGIVVDSPTLRERAQSKLQARLRSLRAERAHFAQLAAQ